MSDPGPRQEAEKAKLSGNRRGVGWVHSTEETLEQSREERWRRGRREGPQSEEEVDAEATPRTQRRPRRVTRGADPRIEPKRAAQAPNVDHVRPPTRARCGKAARRDLRGRCRVPGTSTRQVVLGPTLRPLDKGVQDHRPPPIMEGTVDHPA